MTGIDISERFVQHAREAEAEQQLGVDYKQALSIFRSAGRASISLRPS